MRGWRIAGEMAVIGAASLRLALHARPSIELALARFLFELAAQSLQTEAWNRLHTLEARAILLTIPGSTRG
jgi:hypothetical protein